MGCRCSNSSSQESLVDEILGTIPLRNIYYNDLIEELNKYIVRSNLSETGFQTFFNEFLFCPNYKDSNSNLLNYWLDIYKTKPSSLQFTLIKFNLFLLCKSTKESFDKISNTLLDIVNEYLKVKKIKNKPEIKNETLIGFITVEDLFYLLMDYISSISFRTIEYFKVYHQKPNEFKENLSSAWSLDVIDAFIKITFFSEQQSWIKNIPIKKFFKMYWKIINDDNLIRRKLTEFSIGFNQMNQSKINLSFNEAAS
jgi:hypothetical protein